MLEFYQAYSDYWDLMDLTEELLPFLAREVNGTTKNEWNGRELDWTAWQRLSMREAVIKYWPDAAAPAPSIGDFTDPAKLEAAVNRLNSIRGEMIGEPARINGVGREEIDRVEFDRDDFGKVTVALFEAIAEKKLYQPTIIYDFPKSVSPLSKDKRDEPGWVERFEVFIGGLEVGNAFSELNDPDEQLRRFEDQVKARAAGDQEAMAEVDYDYVRALSYGMPPTAGYGLGIDRLTMLLTDSRSIRDVILFPLLRPEKAAADPDETRTPVAPKTEPGRSSGAAADQP
jgi:lysyl-tRNA synthetase class 2